MSWGKVACAVACGAAGLVDAASGQGAAWRTIVNNGQLMPGSDRPFSSYSPGSVNERGLVVFRARSRGLGQPIRGLYAFDLAGSGPSLLVVGQVGGEGLEDKGEGPRWRSSAFLAIDGFAEGAFRAAFKASIDGTDAILTRVGPAPLGEPVLIAVGGGAEAIDPDAPEGSVITALGIERDSVRADRIIVTASMESTTTKEPWAGQYEADLPPVPSCLGDLNGDGAVSASDLTVLLAEWDCEGACSADLDTDGIVDGVDLAIMLAAWGGCPVG
jgi:hypothetical protein